MPLTPKDIMILLQVRVSKTREQKHWRSWHQGWLRESLSEKMINVHLLLSWLTVISCQISTAIHIDHPQFKYFFLKSCWPRQGLQPGVRGIHYKKVRSRKKKLSTIPGNHTILYPLSRFTLCIISIRKIMVFYFQRLSRSMLRSQLWRGIWADR